MADEHLISLQPGTVICSRYEVVKCLGAGSMGLVYACRNRELEGHMVAVKVLFPEVAQDKVAAARFRNEIFASYEVSHPNVVRAYEYLRDGDLVAYTMEFVGGGDLAERLGRGDRYPIQEIVRLLGEMCQGVQAIHDSGIVHRDLKPENILLTRDGQVKIADFGIARVGHGPKLTEHGGVVGTIDYVAPEYMLNSQVDWRSDIYALGILGYEMITGESPFRGDSVYATMTKRLKCDPSPPSQLNPDCPKSLDKIILHAMERDPEKRYQSAYEIFLDLGEVAREFGISLDHVGVHPLSSSSIGAGSRNGEGGKSVNNGPGKEKSGLASVRSSEAAPEQVAGSERGRGKISWGDREKSRSVKDGELADGQGLLGKNRWVLPRELGEGEFEDDEIDPLAETRVIGKEDYDLAVRSALEEKKARKAAKGKKKSFTRLFDSSPGRSARDSVRERGSRLEYGNPEFDNAEYERLLSYEHDLESTSYMPVAPPAVGAAPIGVASGSIDSRRMRKLSELADRVNRSIWLDVLTLVVAVFIGVGVGIGVLRIFLPDSLPEGPAKFELNIFGTGVDS